MAPGQYRFRVVAANDDGIWNIDGASVTFEIAPAFYQTYWFFGLCVSVSILLLCILFASRVRQHGRQVQMRLAARHAERERIARDLHDTLLQSIQALVLRFQAVSNSLSLQPKSREILERVLDQADLVIAEGRDRVGDLRSTDARSVDLGSALRGAGEELAELYGIPFSLKESGLARPLVPGVVPEIFSIVREAVINGFCHARASRTDCQIRYTRAALNVIVTDDGVGIRGTCNELRDPQQHYGLIGMRERAQSI